ncbi:hypothetical protein BB559_004712 [Furculomyces boomerangus]|uniref:Protein kinase domain-containing protein n=1 Tax=Furculomyces boomerangus TaxID=61424 RepID=A0A2T9YDB3_9FUNG|nr:hypothetical protein BB559_004712 [Furculomyces boomerangus]
MISNKNQPSNLTTNSSNAKEVNQNFKRSLLKSLSFKKNTDSGLPESKNKVQNSRYKRAETDENIVPSNSMLKTPQGSAIFNSESMDSTNKYLTRKPLAKFIYTVQITYDESRKKKVNQYLLEKTLGNGVHGVVKLAQNCETGELVAIKVIEKLPNLMARLRSFKNNYDPRFRKYDVENLQRAKKEISILQKCNHPNVIALKEVIDDFRAKRLFIVMEYAELGEVKWQAQNGIPILKPEEIYKIFTGLVLGLEHLHNLGIIHRDIKPANLLVTKNWQVKIIDFGISFLGNSNYKDILKAHNKLQLNIYSEKDDLKHLPLEFSKLGIKNEKLPDFDRFDKKQVYQNENQKFTKNNTEKKEQEDFNHKSSVDIINDIISKNLENKETPISNYGKKVFDFSDSDSDYCDSISGVITDNEMDLSDTDEFISSGSSISSTSNSFSDKISNSKSSRQRDFYKGNSNTDGLVLDENFSFGDSKKAETNKPKNQKDSNGDCEKIANGELFDSFSNENEKIQKQSFGPIDKSKGTINGIFGCLEEPDDIQELARTVGTPAFFAPELCCSIDELDRLMKVGLVDYDPLNLLYSDANRIQKEYGNNKKSIEPNDLNPEKCGSGKASEIDDGPSLKKDAGNSLVSIKEKCDDFILKSGSEFGSQKCSNSRLVHITPKIDIWAAGVTLYSMAFGSLPFTASNEFELFNIIPRKIPEIPPVSYKGNMEAEENSVSENLKDLLERLLDKNYLSRIDINEIKLHPYFNRNMSDVTLLYEKPIEKQFVNSIEPQKLGKKSLTHHSDIGTEKNVFRRTLNSIKSAANSLFSKQKR